MNRSQVKDILEAIENNSTYDDSIEDIHSGIYGFLCSTGSGAKFVKEYYCDMVSEKINDK